jgi:aminoglycoside phosphotransferase (APT) family kinase protein
MSAQDDDALEALGAALEGIVTRQTGGPAAHVTDMAPLPGHAGFGFSFFVSQAGAPKRRLAVRTIAEGVPAKGPADVVRQARITRSMQAAGVPVPTILWAEDDCPELGRPYFVAGFVEGYHTPDDWRLLTDKDRRLGRRAMQALPLIHAAPWRVLEAEWGPRQGLEEEVERLRRLFDRPTIDPAEGGRAPLLRERLLASLPVEARIGCVHGDFHWGNIIFGEDEVRAIVDWEIAFIGPVLLDLGWICFYADPDAFAGAQRERTRRFGLTPEEMVEAYCSASREPVPTAQVAWFRAFSAYRFGMISLFNRMLHRRGKRHDPSWEETGASVPQMAERGLELLAADGV